MEHYTAIPTLPRPFTITFDDQATSEGVGWTICQISATTMNIHIIEESYLYIMFLKVLLMI